MVRHQQLGQTSNISIRVDIGYPVRRSHCDDRASAHPVDSAAALEQRDYLLYYLIIIIFTLLHLSQYIRTIYHLLLFEHQAIA